MNFQQYKDLLSVHFTFWTLVSSSSWLSPQTYTRARERTHTLASDYADLTPSSSGGAGGSSCGGGGGSN